ncbi:uncharacterized protein H6S33_010947 [Morchella sextelata]|uniref:uncharacterized protein n=1 Tax=Morchella sextelata TaxID=1174677 RepID=UPI001D044EE1|nr:uncharacterized protein H6S33_010947 [Morchella sextelata]KAH0611682.1 hypothetical protein H6S33_010947 [Morchella sextelata]
MSGITWFSNPDLRVPGTFGTPSPATTAQIPEGAYVPYGTIPVPPTSAPPAPPTMPPAAHIVDRGAKPSWFYVPQSAAAAPPPVASPPPPTYVIAINYAPQIQAPPYAPNSVTSSSRSHSRAITSAPHSQAPSTRSHTPSSASRRSQMSPPPIPASGTHAPSHTSHRSSATRASHGGSHSGHMSPPPRYDAPSRPPIGMIAPPPPGYQASSFPPRTDYVQRPPSAVTRGSSRPPTAPEVPSHASSRHTHRSGTSRGSDARSVRSPPPSASAGSRSATPSARSGGGHGINIIWGINSGSRGGSGGPASTSGTLRPEDSISNVWGEADRERSRRDDARREERRARRR